MKKPVFWLLLALASAASIVIGFRYFPLAFSIVSLDITMDRGRALAAARDVMAEEHLGPAGYRQAASFSLDEATQTFVELEGGGKDTFLRMIRDGLYSAYTWRVRQFKEGETNETTVLFTPDGRRYGFSEKVREDAPGAALAPAAARAIAEAGARARWGVDLDRFALVEQGQEKRQGGRVDHTFTYERSGETLNEGRYRLHLVVSGDRLTEVEHSVKIPEAFSRRYSNMRAANDAIGAGSAIGMVLLYVVGGIGVGLFVMLRQRWVVVRPAAVWGMVIGALQGLALLNDWPLMWMSYDTALPRSTFILQQIAGAVALFVGMSVFMALSFMAAETLTRRAFGRHPQLWHAWSKSAGSSTGLLGRTVAGYLLVAVFFAYDVLLYFAATKWLGWWSPAEALLHPDVLASYAPWLSAIANSAQAGFWEECMFRAIPIAGAALIGDYFGGRRKPFLIVAFIVQAIVFGAGHAPYPNMPSYARPVELILPSIGFGLLYLYFGLVPSIVLHFTFDVVWFALPIFIADAPGIHFQQAMVVLVTLIPLWALVWRRVQVGTWTELEDADRNVGWVPPPAPERVAAPEVVGGYVLSPRSVLAWYVVGGISGLVCLAAAFAGRTDLRLPVTRAEAIATAKRAIEERGGKVDPPWRGLGLTSDGSDAPHQFVSQTAGEDRRRELLGTYLPKPNWRVRFVRFEGDVAERAEEWQVSVRDTGEAGLVNHVVPEDRPGATLDEAAARELAHTAVTKRTGLDAAKGDVREVSAQPRKRKARTDWEFTFADNRTTLPQGECWIVVNIAGDQVASTGRLVHVPEEWERQQRNRSTRDLILSLTSAILYGGIMVLAVVGAVISWSRRRFSPGVLAATTLAVLSIAAMNLLNGWPSLMANLSTAQPIGLQIAMLGGIAAVGFIVLSICVGLAMGALPHKMGNAGGAPSGVGIAVGLFAAAVGITAAWLRAPAWARIPDVGALSDTIPSAGVVLPAMNGLVLQTALLLTALVVVHQVTAGWSRRRAAAAGALFAIGFLHAGTPAGSDILGWIAAGTLLGIGLIVVYVSAVRADLTLVPLALAASTAVAAMLQGIGRPFPGALGGAIACAFLAVALGAGLRHLLATAARRAHAIPNP